MTEQYIIAISKKNKGPKLDYLLGLPNVFPYIQEIKATTPHSIYLTDGLGEKLFYAKRSRRFDKPNSLKYTFDKKGLNLKIFRLEEV